MIPEEFKTYFTSLSESSQELLITGLLDLKDDSSDLKEDLDARPNDCPHCGSGSVIGNGHLNGVQRYRCKACSKYFSTTTGKFWYNIKKKDKLKSYMHCLLSGYSIRKSANLVGISKQTSFNWRHKLLTSFSSISPEIFTGIVESDETFFLYSEKGNKNIDRPARKRGSSATRDGINDQHVAVISTVDRTGKKDLKVATRGRISKKDVKKILANKIDPTAILCSDGHPSYRGFVRETTLTHKTIIASKGQRVTEKIYHLQNVNNLDMRLKKFMIPFNGVATKYLQNYLNWFLTLEHLKNNVNKIKTISTIAFASHTCWEEFKNIDLNHMLVMT